MIANIVISKNNLFFYFLILGYLFGVVLYDFLNFNYTDELMAFFLLFFVAITVWERGSIKQLKPIFILLSVFSFYIIYSFVIHSNTPIAILKDAVIQIKPFLAFLCTLIIAPILSKNQKLFTMILCMIVGLFILLIYLTGNMWSFFFHPSRLATTATVTALLFLYCSSFKWADVFLFLFLLTIGLLSTRSKFYGFYGVSVLLLFYFKLGGRVKFDVKTLLITTILIGVALFLSWEKIVLYYIDGSMNSREMWSRPAMMLTALLIFRDYLPFGSGLASFGTFVSGEYYSTIYSKYKIDGLYGITKENPMFIADAYYPELAQFGIIGFILYFAFWGWILKSGLKSETYNKPSMLLIIMIVLFFLIEGIADSTFIHNRGLFVMILLGMIMGVPSKEEPKFDINRCS